MFKFQTLKWAIIMIIIIHMMINYIDEIVLQNLDISNAILLTIGKYMHLVFFCCSNHLFDFPLDNFLYAFNRECDQNFHFRLIQAMISFSRRVLFRWVKWWCENPIIFNRFLLFHSLWIIEFWIFNHSTNFNLKQKCIQYDFSHWFIPFIFDFSGRFGNSEFYTMKIQ